MLAVDDEPYGVELVARALGRQYDVLTTTSGAAAIDHLLAGSFDLVISDVVMPAPFDGPSIYRAAVAYDSRYAERFLFVTGGATDAAVQAFLTKVEPLVMYKPFSVTELRRVVAARLCPAGGDSA